MGEKGEVVKQEAGHSAPRGFCAHHGNSVETSTGGMRATVEEVRVRNFRWRERGGKAENDRKRQYGRQCSDRIALVKSSDIRHTDELQVKKHNQPAGHEAR